MLDGEYKLRLVDFGVAEVFDEELAGEGLAGMGFRKDGGEAVVGGYVGSKHHISPEMIRRSRQNAGGRPILAGTVSSTNILPTFPSLFFACPHSATTD